ncbi:MAG: hypothetical protein AAFP90_24370, partial [Planctomycetota bacterium]
IVELDQQIDLWQTRLSMKISSTDASICSPPQTLKRAFVMGGGGLVNTVRNLDATRPMDAHATHWRCVDLLQTTFEIMREWLQCSRHPWHFVDAPQADPAELAQTIAAANDQNQNFLVSIRSFYRRSTVPKGNDRSCRKNSQADALAAALPSNWETTTDSLAALACRYLKTDRLILVKSCDTPVDGSAACETTTPKTLRSWRESTIVDGAFPRAAAGLRVTLENLLVQSCHHRE